MGLNKILSPTEIETSEPLKSSSRLANSKASPSSISTTTLLLPLSTFRTPLMPREFLRITLAFAILSPFTQIAYFWNVVFHEIAYFLKVSREVPYNLCAHRLPYRLIAVPPLTQTTFVLLFFFEYSSCSSLQNFSLSLKFE